MNDFISIHTIVCPYCGKRQTGIIRDYKRDGQTIGAVRCCTTSCQRLISGGKLLYAIAATAKKNEGKENSYR